MLRIKMLLVKKIYQEVSDSIEMFYQECWNSLELERKLSSEQIINIKEKIFDELVSNNNRILYYKGQVKDENERKVIEKLRKEGLVRIVLSERNEYYQLSHDRLIEPFKKDILKSKERTFVDTSIKEENESLILKINHLNLLYKRYKKVLFLLLCIAVGALLYKAYNDYSQKRLKWNRFLKYLHIKNLISFMQRPTGLMLLFLNIVRVIAKSEIK